MSSLANALALAALVASVFLFFSPATRIPAAFAVVASGLEVLMAYGVIHLSVSRFSVGLVLGLVLLVAGVLAYLRASAKSAVSAGTIAVLVGAIQVLRGVGAF